jgi:hypothetical protein
MKGQLRCRLFMQHLPVIDRMQDEWAVQGRGLLMQHWLVIWQDTGGRSDLACLRSTMQDANGGAGWPQVLLMQHLLIFAAFTCDFGRDAG